MKLAIITGTYPPTAGAGARLARMFEPISENHDIHIFAIGSFVNENTDYKDDNFYIHKVKLPLTMPIAKLVFSGMTKRYLFERMNMFGVFDAIFSYYDTPWAYLALSASKKKSIPLFSNYTDLETHKNNIIYKTITMNILKKTFRSSFHVFPESKFLKDRLINFYKIPKERVTVVPNGVDTEDFNPMIDGSKIKERFGLSDYFVIGYSGALMIDWIRLDVLFEAFKKLKKDYDYIKLLIVGGKKIEIEKLKILCKKMGIENEVIFTGSVPYSEIPDYIAAFDLAVATYSNVIFIRASSPLKIMEYMSMGKAVVADKIGSKTIKNKENGILFEPEDAESLENAMRMILEDSRLKRKLEINARETALKYDWKIVSKKLEDIMIENV